MLSTSTPPFPSVLLGELATLEPDCAPAPLAQQLAQPSREHLYECVRDLYLSPLTSDWVMYCNTLAGGTPAVLHRSAIARLESFVTCQPLIDDLDEQLAVANLVTPIGTSTSPPRNQSTTLTAWLHVTNACNLDCPYCYVRKSGAKMTLAVGIRAIDAIVTTAIQRGFTTVKLKYAGGEAVLHYKLVQQLHRYALEQAARSGVELKAVVLSNGTTIPPQFADWLQASGVRLMVSVDGIGEAHDTQRPWKGRGKGAFAALERNLLMQLLPRGIRPDICITITGRTAASACTAVEWAMQYDLPFSLNFYRENEQSAKYHDLRLEEGQIIDGMLAAYARIEQKLPTRPFLDGLLDRVQASAHSHTCGVGQNYVVITHEGFVAQCQMDLQSVQEFDSANDLIQLVAHGTLPIVPVDDKEGCRDCLWRYRCAGGCPIVTLRATGRVDIKSPHCNIYQKLMPAALRLEGLRILKVHSQDNP